MIAGHGVPCPYGGRGRVAIWSKGAGANGQRIAKHVRRASAAADCAPTGETKNKAPGYAESLGSEDPSYIQQICLDTNVYLS
jgi:hypothetical protein